ncbi:hypothetical protein RUM43_007198 [Polyplax serrata]|uniref:Uncharacterized protein n=1 Tax=Polyplax serrata TaxID=468196 RepID=A0AAN8S1B4_POLSC
MTLDKRPPGGKCLSAEDFGENKLKDLIETKETVSPLTVTEPTSRFPRVTPVPEDTGTDNRHDSSPNPERIDDVQRPGKHSEDCTVALSSGRFYHLLLTTRDRVVFFLKRILMELVLTRDGTLTRERE